MPDPSPRPLAPKSNYTIGTVEINMTGGKMPFHFRRGTTDEAIIQDIFIRNDYNLGNTRERQPDLVRFMTNAAANNKPPLIIDGGANIGTSSVYFCAYHPAVRVVAIEPNKGNFDILEMNCRNQPITPMRAALSGLPGRAEVIDPDKGNVGFQTKYLAADASADSVPCVTINELYAAQPHLTPFAVKIDIEGFEKELFSANTEWVEHTPLIIIELHDWMMPKAGTAQPFLKCISQYDRDFVHMGENIFSISNSI